MNSKFFTPLLLLVSQQALSQSLRVEFSELQGFSSSELVKVHSAADILERTVNSPEFRSAITNHTYQGQKTFVQNNGLSNEQIYEKILTGAEMLKPEINHTIDLNLTIYWSSWFSRGTVGYTYPDTLRIWVNRRHFQYFEPRSVAANMMHEWMHKIGFDHDFKSTSRRPYSVPYAVGELVIKTAQQLGY